MSSRPLTAGETLLLQDVYGDAINLGKVEISDDPFIPGQGKYSMAPFNTIHVGGTFTVSQDFSQLSVTGFEIQKQLVDSWRQGG